MLVTSVGYDSPAAKAGIRAGDVITAVDGEKIEGAAILTCARKKKEGDVTLTMFETRISAASRYSQGGHTTIVPRERARPGAE